MQSSQGSGSRAAFVAVLRGGCGGGVGCLASQRNAHLARALHFFEIQKLPSQCCSGKRRGPSHPLAYLKLALQVSWHATPFVLDVPALLRRKRKHGSSIAELRSRRS